MACSFILTVALASFNIYVSADLPKLSYATFMDQCVPAPLLNHSSCILRTTHFMLFVVCTNFGLFALAGMLFLFVANQYRYVIMCFSFALVSVFEYATVHYFITQPEKSLVAVGRAMDRFFQITAPPMWMLLLLLFLIYSKSTLTAMVVLWLVWLAFGFRNVLSALYLRFLAVVETVCICTCPLCCDYICVTCSDSY